MRVLHLEGLGKANSIRGIIKTYCSHKKRLEISLFLMRTKIEYESKKSNISILKGLK